MIFFPRGRLVPRSVGWIALRSALLTEMWIASYFALRHLPLAVAAHYKLPLWIVTLAALIGGERVRPMQWADVALGFGGILLVLRPGGKAFRAVAVLPLGSAIFYAPAMILTRTNCRDEHPATLALGLNATFVVTGVAGLLLGSLLIPGAEGFLSPDWTPTGSAEWRSVAILAVLILVASVGTAIAYQLVSASTVGTFDFAYVGVALIWGAVFFAERPDAVALAGIALIVAAGVLAVRRPRGV